MTIDLAAVIAANNAVQADTLERTATRKWAAAATAALQAIVGPAPTPVAGIGALQYGGSLGTLTHLADGTYSVVIADVGDAAALGKVSGLGFAYFNTLASDAVHVNLSDPPGFVATALALQASSGVAGIFLDNVGALNPAWKAGALLPFLQAVRAGLRGHMLVMLNVNGAGLHGDVRDDNGQSQCEMIAALSGLADYLMCENWQQVSGGKGLGNVRVRSSSGGLAYQQSWDGWQTVIATTHQAGAYAVVLSYGYSVGTGAKPTDGLTAMQRAVYCRASAITAPDWNPRDAFVYNNGDGVTTTGTDPWSQTWVAAPVSPSVVPVPPVKATL